MTGRKGRSGGHNRKPTATLRRDGGFKKHRHADRLDNHLTPPGDPRKPDGLSPPASALWDQVTGTLPDGCLGEIDTAMLTGLCQWFQAYRDAETLMERCKCWDRFSRLAIEYGLTPSARASLKVARVEEEPDNPVAQLLARRMGHN